MADLFVKALQLHQLVYERSGGWVGHRLLFGMPTLLLHSVGRKSGQPRTSALTYGRDGARYLVVASKGGAPTSPAWMHNVLAAPTCEIQVGRDRITVVARKVVPGDPEYDRMWATMNAINHGRYSEYQKKTDRPIPVIALTPNR
ncbi:nitroreductase family deazaflavin-dependent oxidoreductase [Rhodococcus opacus]|uniref:Nitroreductase family deazaflavin-dependent oxidoreductase n=1 Tax=Rhodococcus opacus TaxID=37919 RepID=A0A2S8JE21_RHOOP|nr:nitroreductase family deazaflavin-dependent oxidoreductase [Rhodococcus opacus]PQP25255.1 nitroreductase family deazaflavin-dependent oxidoreductase [Rhodococcus opacus]